MRFPPPGDGIRSYSVAGRCCSRSGTTPDIWVALVAVDEVFETNLRRWRVDSLRPLADHRCRAGARLSSSDVRSGPA